MPRDSELDRLKAAKDSAFRRQQDAYTAQQTAWQARRAAGDVMNTAYHAKQEAWQRQNNSWNTLKQTRDINNPRIDALKAQSDRAHQNMQNAFANASSAYDSGDRAGAGNWSAQGKQYRAERDGYNVQVRQLIAENQAAQRYHEPNRAAFQQAKADFVRAQNAFHQAKAVHVQAEAAFKAAKAQFAAAKQAFDARLDAVREARTNDRRSLAEQAGVPHQYRNDVRVSRKPDGVVNLYFGGEGTPDGPGHGHYVLNPDGTVPYRRDPFEAHGGHNFVASQTDYFDAIRTESVGGSNEFGFNCTYKGIYALVETGYDTQTGRQKINIFYGGRGHPLGPGHGHAVAYRDDPYTIVTDRSPR